MHSQVARLYAHMHMQPKNEVGTCGFLHFLHYLKIARMIRDQLVLPMRIWMRTCCPDAQTLLTGQHGYRTAQFANFFPVLPGGAANVCAHLHYGLVHFGLYLVLMYLLRTLHNLL